MQEHKKSLFFEKFSLLKSQEHNEDIKWSSSSSSDYENTSNNDKLCTVNNNNNRKRKRKKKVPKNLSNLDITIIDASKDNKKNTYTEKSPILVMKCLSPTSPILKSKFAPNKPNSPILSVKSLHKKSPILMLKNSSPKYSSKVRKKLPFNEGQTSEKRDSEIFICSSFIKPDRGTNHLSQVVGNINSIQSSSSTNEKSELLESLSDKSESALKAKLTVINKVKNYFDSYFSSENTSQNISDTPSPEECIKKEPIEILTCRTQTICSMQPSKHESFNSDTTNYFEKNKKVKYKKGGLAYRLNALLKKQDAHISLWQHERFLAGTSNFVIPKGEYVVFCIQKVQFLYGCYLLEAIDVKNEKYIIFINHLYVNNNVTNESVFKLYEPYRILELDKDYKVVINVSKFECVSLNKPRDSLS